MSGPVEGASLGPEATYLATGIPELPAAQWLTAQEVIELAKTTVYDAHSLWYWRRYLTPDLPRQASALDLDLRSIALALARAQG